jgi:medium-chain acyl-[acyl-carrier-protein] hydrolase
LSAPQVTIPTRLNGASAEGGARSRLVLLPYAGGSAAVYHPWRRLLASDFEVQVIELPGRGQEIRRALLDEPEPVLAELEDQLRRTPAPRTFLFGHSMGARLALALSERVPVDGVVVSCAPAPGAMPSWKTMGRSDEQLLAEAKALGGFPDEVLAHRELLELVLPVLRADLLLLERLEARALRPLSCPLAVYWASDDPAVPRSAALAWSKWSARSPIYWQATGGHFAPFQQPASSTAWLRGVLRAFEANAGEAPRAVGG